MRRVDAEPEVPGTASLTAAHLFIGDADGQAHLHRLQIFMRRITHWLGSLREWSLYSFELVPGAHGRASATRAPTCVQAVRKPSVAAKSFGLTTVCCGRSSGLPRSS